MDATYRRNAQSSPSDLCTAYTRPVPFPSTPRCGFEGSTFELLRPGMSPSNSSAGPMIVATADAIARRPAHGRQIGVRGRVRLSAPVISGNKKICAASLKTWIT
jgi:hypothetical protein